MKPISYSDWRAKRAVVPTAVIKTVNGILNQTAELDYMGRIVVPKPAMGKEANAVAQLYRDAGWDVKFFDDREHGYYEFRPGELRPNAD